MRHIHNSVISGTVIEAGGSRIKQPSTNTKNGSSDSSTSVVHDHCPHAGCQAEGHHGDQSVILSKPNPAIGYQGNDQQLSLLTTTQPRIHTVRILSPVIQSQQKEKLAQSMHA